MADTRDTPALAVKSLTKTFGDKRVLDGVSFEVRRGEVTGLLGPNGAGKTTTLRVLVDLLKPDSGSIEFAGRLLDREGMDCIGYLPEERGLYKRSRVVDTLCFFAALKSVPRSVAEPRARELLARVGLGEQAESKCEALSKGMQQKAQLVAALIHDPDVILLDEPFSGLDPMSIQQVRTQIRELRAAGKAVLLSTHLMGEAEALCDRVLMLHRGQVVMDGPVAGVRERFVDDAAWTVECEGDLPPCPLAKSVERLEDAGEWQLTLEPDGEPSALLEWLAASATQVRRVERHMPSLEQIFVQVATDSGEAPAGGAGEGDA